MRSTYYVIDQILCTATRMRIYHVLFNRSKTGVIQGDQKVSVHLMITIQEVTSNVQSVPRQSPDIYWTPNCIRKTVFSIARSTFRMYSV